MYLLVHFINVCYACFYQLLNLAVYALYIDIIAVRGGKMAPRFPLYIDLYDNHCTIFGGGQQAALRAKILLQFGAKVTVISPTLCNELKEMDKKQVIRYVPRRYYRGDCTSSYLCVAATDNETVNISISDECKAKAIAVNVTRPSAFGTFFFPRVLVDGNVTVSLDCGSDQALFKQLWDHITNEFPTAVKCAREDCLLRGELLADK